MKKFLLFGFLSMYTAAFAQGGALDGVANDYSRNSVSIIVIDRGDGFDRVVYDLVKEFKLGSKFDANPIAVDRLSIPNVPRHAESTPVSQSAITNALVQSKVSNHILRYWFDSDGDGYMSGDLVAARGLFNASDQDVMSASASKIGSSALEDAGYSLINNSYVLVVDLYRIEVAPKGGSWVVSSSISAYKVDLSESQQTLFYEECWVEAGAAPDDVSTKNGALMSMNIGIDHITTVSAQSTHPTQKEKEEGRGNSPKQAASEVFTQSLYELENNIDSWNVTGAVQQTHPIRAKIGTKEGLKNTNRYAAYQNHQDNNGQIYAKQVGYVRATKVADNNSVSTGNSAMSEFYQISSLSSVQPGQTLKQSNDLAMSLSVGYSASPLRTVAVTLDRMIRMQTSGSASYAIVDMGYDIVSKEQLPSSFASSAFDEGFSFMSAGVGFGQGVRISRFLEIMPHAIYGYELMELNSEVIADVLSDDSGEESSSETKKKMASFGRVGVKASLTLAYPLHVWAGLDYSLILSEGETYSYYNQDVDGQGIGRTGGVGINIGVKFNF